MVFSAGLPLDANNWIIQLETTVVMTGISELFEDIQKQNKTNDMLEFQKDTNIKLFYRKRLFSLFCFFDDVYPSALNHPNNQVLMSLKYW